MFGQNVNKVSKLGGLGVSCRKRGAAPQFEHLQGHVLSQSSILKLLFCLVEIIGVSYCMVMEDRPVIRWRQKMKVQRRNMRRHPRSTRAQRRGAR